jgi:hypothetical protein
MDNNIEPLLVTTSTTPARVMMFPRPIVDRSGDFSNCLRLELVEARALLLAAPLQL